MKRRALVTGVTGQTGSYMAEWLLGKDYEVFGLVRRNSTTTMERIAHFEKKLKLVSGDLTDYSSLINVLRVSEPQEIYNFAAQSFVGGSFEYPVATMEATGMGALNLIEACRYVVPHVSFYQASSSEQFGRVEESFQDESTPFYPVSPYGCAKTFAHHIMQTYRAAYAMNIYCGIAFNHESPRRGKEFVTQKLVNASVQVKLGLCQKVPFGNLTTQRDFLHAGDIARAAWMMLQRGIPTDYVIASGIPVTIQEAGEYIFQLAGLKFTEHSYQDKSFFRPSDIPRLCGESSKLRRDCGWKPSMTWQQILSEMSQNAFARAQSNYTVKIAG